VSLQFSLSQKASGNAEHFVDRFSTKVEDCVPLVSKGFSRSPRLTTKILRNVFSWPQKVKGEGLVTQCHQPVHNKVHDLENFLAR
jgi:hypothetical protein